MISEEQIARIADEADMIIRGYAFTRDGDYTDVFNINDGDEAVVIMADGILMATNAAPVENALIRKLWAENAKYMEA